MALSGTIYGTSLGRGYNRLKIVWTATQNVANNTSTITSKLYWTAFGNGGNISSSTSKTYVNRIGGSQSTGSATAGLSVNQEKLINTRTQTVTHNSDGTLTTTVGGTFNIAVTIGGTYYASTSIPNTNITLNKIPRASTASHPEWRALNNTTVSISRSSTSFTHNVVLYIGDVEVARREGVATSAVFNFTVAENKKILQELNGRSSATAELRVATLSGGSTIGTAYYGDGQVLAPLSSSTTGGGRTYNVGDTISGSISRSDSRMYHTIELRFGSGYSYYMHYYSNNTSWSYDTSSIASQLYSAMGSANSLTGTIRIYTFYESIQIRTYTDYNVTFTVPLSGTEPIFNPTISHRDTNSTTVGVTGNDQWLVQGKSYLQVTIPTSDMATPQAGATITHYVASIAGTTVRVNHPNTLTFNMGYVNAWYSQTLSVTVYDSRGNSTRRTKIINAVPYSDPSSYSLADRLNGFEDQTTIIPKGTFSPVNINGVNKNTITSVATAYKLKTSSIYSNISTNNSPQISGSNFSIPNRVVNLNKSNAYDVRITIVDRFGTVYDYITISEGRPILFIDTVKGSVGIGKMPDSFSSLEVDWDLRVGNNVYAEELHADGRVMGGDVASVGSMMVGYYDTRPTTLRNSGSYGFEISKMYGDMTLGLYTDRTQFDTSASRFQFTKPVTLNSTLTMGTNTLTAGRATFSYVTDAMQITTDTTNTQYNSGMSMRSGGTEYGRLFKVWNTHSIRLEANRSNKVEIYAPKQIHIRTTGTLTHEEVRLETRLTMLRVSNTTAATYLRNGDDSGYTPIYASAFNISSRRDAKKNIQPLDFALSGKTALEEVLSTPVYRYHYNNDSDDELLRTGLIYDEAPCEAVDISGEGVDIYGMTSLLWKAVQELSEELDILKNDKG